MSKMAIDLQCPCCPSVATDLAYLTFGIQSQSPIGGDLAIVTCCMELVIFRHCYRDKEVLLELRELSEWELHSLDDDHVAVRSLMAIREAWIDKLNEEKKEIKTENEILGPFTH